MSYDSDCYCEDIIGADPELCVFCEMAIDSCLRNLGKNITIAGALARAYRKGWEDASDKYVGGLELD